MNVQYIFLVIFLVSKLAVVNGDYNHEDKGETDNRRGNDEDDNSQNNDEEENVKENRRNNDIDKEGRENEISQRKRRGVEGALCEGILGVHYEMSKDKLRITKNEYYNLEISWTHLITKHLECVDRVDLYKYPETEKNPIDQRKPSTGGDFEKRPFSVTLTGDEICWKQTFFIKVINFKIAGNDEQKSEEVEYIPKVNDYYNDQSEIRIENTENSSKIFFMTNLFADWNYKRCLKTAFITLNEIMRTVSNADTFDTNTFEDIPLDPCVQSTVKIAYFFQTAQDGHLETKQKHNIIGKQKDCHTTAIPPTKEPKVFEFTGKKTCNETNPILGFFIKENCSYDWIPIGGISGGTGLVLLVLLILTGCCIKGCIVRRRERNVEIVDDNPEYGYAMNSFDDYADTAIVDTNDYYGDSD